MPFETLQKLTISDRFVDHDIFMRYLGLGIGHTLVVQGEAANSTDDSEEEVDLAGTGLSDTQHDDWGMQGGEQLEDDQTFEQDIDGNKDEDEEAADLDKAESEDEETDELEDLEEDDGDHS